MRPIAKTVQPGTLALLVREICAGTIHHAFDGQRAAATSVRAHANLTPRELEILLRVAGGASNANIARELWVTEQTVKFHLSNVYRKLRRSEPHGGERTTRTSTGSPTSSPRRTRAENTSVPHAA